MYFQQKLLISTLKLVDMFTYFGSNISSAENYVSIRLAKAWNVIDRPLIIWISNLSDKIKSYFFQTVVVDLVSLFNGISIFTGYLMPKLFSLKNSNGTI